MRRIINVPTTSACVVTPIPTAATLLAASRRGFLSKLFGGGQKSGSSTSTNPDTKNSRTTTSNDNVNPMSPEVSYSSSASAASFPRSVEDPKGAFVGNFPSSEARLDSTHFYNKVPYLRPTTTLTEASVFLSMYDVGCVPVLDDTTKEVIGMLSERDLARWIGKKNGYRKKNLSSSETDPSHESSCDADTTTVSDVMATNVIACTEDTTLEKALSLMDEHNFRHLPVILTKTSNGLTKKELVGLLSMRDIMHQHVKGKGSGDVDDFMSWVLRMSR